MRRALPLLVTLVLLAGCSEDASPGTVRMTEAQLFQPETLRVRTDTTVTFVNESSEAHTVTAYEDRLPPGAAYFSSGGSGSEEEARDNLSDALIGPDGTYEVTLDEPGTYEYFCIPHEEQGMIGTIYVESG